MAIESAADRSVFLGVDDFGISVTYTPIVGSAVSLNGIFDSGYEEVDLPGSIDVSLALSRSRLVVRTADLPSAAADGDAVTVSSVAYVVKILAADGEGMTELIMVKLVEDAVAVGGIDTALKRRSVSGVPMPWMIGVTPDATPDEAWRRSVGWTYGDPLA